jgi:plastocyanin
MLLITSCSSNSDAETSTPVNNETDAVVLIADRTFSPERLDVTAGDTVTWSFRDGARHDVTFDSGPASPAQGSGTWTHTFDDPGVYDYVCTLHRGMTGTVIVEDVP